MTYVAYRDETQQDLLVASREADAGTWAIQRIATAGDVGEGTSIATSADGTVHVSYYDRGASRMKYARKQIGGSWTFETLDNTAIFVPGRTSLRVDSSGNPKVALYANNTLRFAERSGAGWTSVQVDATAGTLASLALDASDNPHISYSISGNQIGAKLQLLKYATRSGTAWSTQSVFQNTVIGAAIESSIALDGTGQPHIVFYDSNFLSLKYAKKNGASWVVQVVAGNGAGSGNSLAFDPTGGLHATYYDFLAGKLKYATLSAGSWTSIIVDGINVPEAFSSLSFDTAGNPHVAYWDAVPDGHLRYAH